MMACKNPNTPPTQPSVSCPLPGASRGVFIVEDHPVTRAGLAAIVRGTAGLHVCGEVDSAPLAIAQIPKAMAALALVDIGLKSSNGIELIKGLAAILPALRILVVSAHREEVYAERAIRAGAHGYVMKDAAAEKIVTAIRTILQGGVYKSPTTAAKLNGSRRCAPEANAGVDTLSDREMEVFALLGDGYTTREIAQRLHLSVKTVDTYRESMKRKLGLPTSAEVVRHAVQWARSVPPVPGLEQ